MILICVICVVQLNKYVYDFMLAVSCIKMKVLPDEFLLSAGHLVPQIRVAIATLFFLFILF